MGLILALAFALRAWLGLAFPSYDHADEIFQALEQAHRLLFGYGIVPWEFRQGARSWMLPGLVSLVMAPASWISASPAFYLGAVTLELAALALLPVWAAWEIGRRFGLDEAVCAAFAVAAGLGLAMDSVRPLGEMVAADLMLAGLALLMGPATARRMLLAGLALGAATAFRFHLAPAIAVAAIIACRLDFRGRWLPVVAGGLVPVAFLGLLDWATWGVPWASVINNFISNVVEGKASIYGVAPANWYLTTTLAHYGALCVLLVPLALIGSLRAPVLLVVAAVIVLEHSAIPHKDYRFIYPALLCLAVLVGLGFGTCVALIRRHFRIEAIEAAVLPVALGATIVASVVASLAPEVRRGMLLRHNALDAFAVLHDDPAACGVAYADGRVYSYAGYSGLHRPLPFHLLSSLQAAHKEAAANVIMVQVPGPAPRAPRPDTRCFDDGSPTAVCIIERPGPCDPAPELELNNDPSWAGHWR